MTVDKITILRGTRTSNNNKPKKSLIGLPALIILFSCKEKVMSASGFVPRLN